MTQNSTLDNLFPYIWNNIRDIIFLLSPEGKITFVSREIEFATGWNQQELIGKDFLDIVHPDDLKIVIDGFHQILGGDSPPPYEARVKAKNGSYLTFEAKGTPQIEDGEIIGYLGIARDVTERKKMEEQLKTSERQHRIILNSIGEPLHVIDRNLIIVLQNPAFSTWLTILKLDSIIRGKKLSEAFPFLPKSVYEEYTQVFETGKPVKTEEMTRINGGKYYTETRKIPIFNEEQSEVIQILTIIRDITDQKVMEKNLRSSEERLRSFMDAATDSFSLWDSELNLVELNSAAIEFFRLGFPVEDLIGKNFKDFTNNPEDINNYANVLRTGKPYIAERTTSPEKFGDMVLSVKAFKVGNGLGIITTDITKRKQMEDELKENEEKFRSIFAKAPIGMVLLDLNFKFSQVNTSFCHMLGFEEQDLLEMTCLEITHEDHKKRDERKAKELIEGRDQIYQTEKKFIKKNGEHFWANATLTLLKDKEDSPQFLLGMIEDITVAKKQEEEIKSQLLKYKVDEGTVYLIKESSPILPQNVLDDLIKFGYDATIISRSPKIQFTKQITSDFHYFRLTTENNLEFVSNKIKELPRKNVLFLDRLEFLYLRNSFDDVMNLIYQLNEDVYLNNSVVLLYIDTSTLTDRQLSTLEKEIPYLEPRFMAKISEEYLSILRFIFQQNNSGVKPSYSDIGNELQISRPTARKRIKHLNSVGYLSEHRIGKTKRIELSSKGELLFAT